MAKLDKHLLRATLISGLLMNGACSSDDDDSSDSGTESSTSVEESNQLAEAYPSTLALSVLPTETTSSSLKLQSGTTSSATNTDKKPPKEKVEDRQAILKGGSDAECFAGTLLNDRQGESISCYEFDNDMNPFTGGPAGSGGTTDGKHTDGEACMVAFARQQVLDATQYVDRALDTVAGVLCAVKKAGGDTSPPAENVTRDFLADLSPAPIGLTKATMVNLGSGLYKTSLALDNDGKKLEMVLVYKKGTNENEGSGIITYKKLAPSSSSLQSDQNNSSNMNQYVSVEFSQALNDQSRLRNKFEVRIASIEKSLDGLDSKGIINYDVIPDAAENSTSNNFEYVQFDIDSESGEGNMSYWRNPGGRLNEAARGFIFNVTADATTGVLSGCGASGATSDISIRGTLASDGSGSTALIPSKFWHPFGNSNTSPNKDDRYTSDSGPFITSQCFTLNTSTGMYDIDYVATKALSDSTTESEIDSHGYDVIPKDDGNNKIKPPEKPSNIPDGEFKEASS